MAPNSRSLRAAKCFIDRSKVYQKRAYSQLTEDAETASESSTISTTSSTSPPANVAAAIILSRTPIITPSLSPFEKAYYHYQDELERRLMWTFPQFFYYKKGTLLERTFVAAQKGPVTKQPGVYYPKGIPDIKFNRERRYKQEIVIPRDENSSKESDSVSKPIVPNPRITEADQSNDIKSLTRKLDRTLYLIVKDSKTGRWKFPSFDLKVKEPLHITAENGLRIVGGPNFNTWTVSNTPAAVLKYSSEGQLLDNAAETSPEDSLIKEFFIKSHILHGQFVVQKDSGISDFNWLSKDELSSKFEPGYYRSIEPLLSEQ